MSGMVSHPYLQCRKKTEVQKIGSLLRSLTKRKRHWYPVYTYWLVVLPSSIDKLLVASKMPNPKRLRMTTLLIWYTNKPYYIEQQQDSLFSSLCHSEHWQWSLGFSGHGDNMAAATLNIMTTWQYSSKNRLSYFCAHCMEETPLGPVQTLWCLIGLNYNKKTAPVYLAGFEHCSPYGPKGKPAFPEVQEPKKAGQSEGSASKEESGNCLKRRELIAGHATQMWCWFPRGQQRDSLQEYKALSASVTTCFCFLPSLPRTWRRTSSWGGALSSPVKGSWCLIVPIMCFQRGAHGCSTLSIPNP